MNEYCTEKYVLLFSFFFRTASMFSITLCKPLAIVELTTDGGKRINKPNIHHPLHNLSSNDIIVK
jgi:hypothetical protein